MRFPLFILFLSLNIISCKKETPKIPIGPSVEFESIRNEIIDLVSSGNTPSFGIAVIHKDSILWQEVINKDTTHESVSITHDGVFELASVTKSITATMIMKLVQDGKISLDDPIEKYVKLSSEEKLGKDKTIKDLLQMQAGIPHGGISIKPGSNLLNSELYQRMHQLYNISVFPKGVHEYSNFSYGLLGQIIETVTQKSYHDALKDEIWNPLDMSATTILKNTEGRSVFLPTGAAGVVSTLEDMIRYAIFHLGSSHKKPLTSENLRRLHLDKSDKESIFALGWGSISTNVAGLWLLTNGSFPESSNTHITLLPSKDIAVICLVNKDYNSTADQMALRITDILLPGFLEEAMNIMSDYENSNNRPLDSRLKAAMHWNGFISDSKNEYSLNLKYDGQEMSFQYQNHSWSPIINPRIDSQGILKGYVENITLIEPISGLKKSTSGGINLYVNDHRSLNGYYLGSFKGDDFTFLDLPFAISTQQENEN